MIYAYPVRTRPGDSVLLALVGAPPWVSVDWSSDGGTLTPWSDYTDATGRCSAVLTTDVEGTITVEAKHGVV